MVSSNLLFCIVLWGELGVFWAAASVCLMAALISMNLVDLVGASDGALTVSEQYCQ